MVLVDVNHCAICFSWVTAHCVVAKWIMGRSNFLTLLTLQIVYNNYRPYVSSPKPTETASLPSGSSLVYVSAIHNAGHFYVQVIFI